MAVPYQLARQHPQNRLRFQQAQQCALGKQGADRPDDLGNDQSLVVATSTGAREVDRPKASSQVFYVIYPVCVDVENGIRFQQHRHVPSLVRWPRSTNNNVPSFRKPSIKSREPDTFDSAARCRHCSEQRSITDKIRTTVARGNNIASVSFDGLHISRLTQVKTQFQSRRRLTRCLPIAPRESLAAGCDAGAFIIRTKATHLRAA